jgi:hypothetical protein
LPRQSAPMPPGDSTGVETTVAMEFAASWKPLM